MSKSQGNVLESFIKVEPQEFGATTVDDILRFKANIFSDPIVLVERFNSEISFSPFSIAAQSENENISMETVKISGRKRLNRTKWSDPHSCSICQKVLANRDTFKKHFEAIHSRSTRMLCDLCPKVYFSRQSINSHMKTVHCKKCFACNVCDFKTAHKHHVQKHKMIHAAKVECPVCKKQVSVLKSHMESHKPKKPCPICRKMFLQQSFRRHMSSTHNKIKCTDCNEVLENKEDLRRHKLMRHYEGQIFECHCGSVFNTKGSLKEHQQAVHSLVKSTCEVCQKGFAAKKTLKAHWRDKHLKTHGILYTGTEIRDLKRGGPFICDDCGSKHTSRSAFKQHTHKHHRFATFLCDLCPRSFIQKCFLVEHFRKSHLILQPYQCKDCKFQSFYKSSLKTHIKQHGPKTECKVCHKLVKNMKEHLRNHVKAKCPICSRILSKVNLSKHLKTHKK